MVRTQTPQGRDPPGSPLRDGSGSPASWLPAVCGPGGSRSLCWVGGRQALPHLAQTPSVSPGRPVAGGVWTAPTYRRRLVCRGGPSAVPLCPSSVCLALESQRNFHCLELFVDLSRAHEGALGGSAWSLGLCGDRPRSAREPAHTGACRRGHRQAGPEVTGVRSAEVRQPPGCLLSLMTSLALEAHFSEAERTRPLSPARTGGPLGGARRPWNV